MALNRQLEAIDGLEEKGQHYAMSRQFVQRNVSVQKTHAV